MKKAFLFFLCLFGVLQASLAQNLVPNGDFESYSTLPTSAGQWNLANGWSNCNGQGSPDYAHINGSGFAHLPNNYFATVSPHSGDAIMGFIAWHPNFNPCFREYLATALSSPLTIGETYTISFYLTNGVHNGNYGGYGTDKMGVAFSTAALQQPQYANIPFAPQYEMDTMFYDPDWQLVSFQFKADSAYKYITLGNFESDANTALKQFHTGGIEAVYYFIDDISVTISSPHLPVARFQSSDSIICRKNCITYSSSSTNTTSYKWLFPGGSPVASSDSSPVVCYPDSGHYDVQLIASNGTADDTLTLINFVTVLPDAEAGIVDLSRDSLCKGSGLTSQLTTQGSRGALQWQSSANGALFSDLPGDTLSSYTTSPTLAQNTWYRIIAKTSNCTSDTSGIVLLHFLPPPLGAFNWAINGLHLTFNSGGSSSDVVHYFWDFGDGTTSTDANPAHTYAKEDTFNVCLTVYNGTACSFTLCKPVVILNTGLPSVDKESSLRVYSNPADNNIRLSLNGLPSKYQLAIYNSIGQQVIQQQLSISNNISVPVSLPPLVAGTYYLVLFNSQNYFTRPFIKTEK